MGRQINFYIFPSEVPQILDIADEVGLKPVIRAIRYAEKNPEHISLAGKIIPLELAKSILTNNDISLGLTLESLSDSLILQNWSGVRTHLDTNYSEFIELSKSQYNKSEFRTCRLYLQSGYYDKEANWISRSEDLISHYHKLKRRLLSRIFVKRYFGNYLIYMTKSIAQGIDEGKIEHSIAPSYIRVLDGYKPQG